MSRWEWWRYRWERIARKAASTSLFWWFVLAILVLVLANFDWIDRRLHPPFGKNWPWLYQ